jgi:hypothetical protein
MAFCATTAFGLLASEMFFVATFGTIVTVFPFDAR